MSPYQYLSGTGFSFCFEISGHWTLEKPRKRNFAMAGVITWETGEDLGSEI